MTKYHYAPRMTGAFSDVPAIVQGLPGSQSGESVHPTDAVFLQDPSVAGAFAGSKGSQSGPVQESDSAGWERGLQSLAGLGLMGAGGLGGGWAFAPAGPYASLGGASLGAIPGTIVGANSAEPNIQDVWAHKFMQALRKSGLMGR